MTTNLTKQFLNSLTQSEKSYLERVRNKTALWLPQSKTQWQALLSRADETFFGGAAGGGKSALVIGMATELHQHSVIFRRVNPNLKELLRFTREIIGDSAKENKTDKIWVFDDGRTIEFGAVQYESDKTNWQGRQHDLKAFDEITEFTESQYVFITGWNRSTDPNQRVRVIVTGNPPTNQSGSWVMSRWGAWLDPKHPKPAQSGELRWYAVVDSEEIEVESGKPFEIDGETIYPRSRTFIRSLLSDNPFYAHDSHYISVLQSLPEPLRSQMLKGDFSATAEIDPFQVIPTDWVRLAQDRWLNSEKRNVITSAGLDPARGGKDKMSLSIMYDNYFDELSSWPGMIVNDGAKAAELVRHKLGSRENFGFAPLGVDVVGIGSSAYDFLKGMYNNVVPINAASGSRYRDKSKLLKMRNMRAEYYWRFRDALDPENGDDVALPPGNRIIADLCAARYNVTSAGVIIESKDDIKKRLGRSPDEGESILLANQARYAKSNAGFVHVKGL